MADIAHKRTDAIIADLEKQLAKEYGRALRDAEGKLDAYFRRFEARDKRQRELLDAGKITAEDYENWRKRHLLMGKRWEELRDTLAQDFAKVGEIARSIVSGHLPDVYALNHNYSTFQIEHDGRLDTSYTLYNRQTVERLVRDNPSLLPNPTVGPPRAKDLRWNQEHITSSVLQGILQGEPITEIAKRLEDVAQMDYNAAVRTARTAVTSAQNGGRIDSYRRAESMGIDLRKRWLATLDDRTRHEHRLLHGQTVATEEPFTVEGEEIMFPGDPAAPGYLVYNCRCTLISQIKGFEGDTVKESPKMHGMTFDEWQHAAAIPFTQADMEQVREYQTLLGTKAPQNSYAFREIKYYKPDEYEALKRQAAEARKK